MEGNGTPLLGAAAVVLAAFATGWFARRGSHETALGADAASLRSAVVQMSQEIRELHVAHEDCLSKHEDCERRCSRLENQLEGLAVTVERLQEREKRQRGN